MLTLRRLSALRGLAGLALPRDVVALVSALAAEAEARLPGLVGLRAGRDDSLPARHSLFDLSLDLLRTSVVSLVSTASVPPSLVTASALLVASRVAVTLSISRVAASLSVVVVVGHE